MEERLQRIEQGWLNIQASLKAVIDSQTRTNETIQSMTQSMINYAAALDARMTRLETNLDGPIRAITTEHGYGK